MSVARVVVLTVTLTGLSGCVLESPTPLFDDRQAQLVLGEGPAEFRTFRREDGEWREAEPDGPPVRFVPEGKHYVVSEYSELSGTTTRMEISFVPLGTGRLGVQIAEAGKPAYYALARIDSGDVLVTTLSCASLKEKQLMPDSIRHEGSDCTVESVADPGAFLSSLAASAEPPDLKLTPAR